jgi:hypothetical protein
MKKVAVCIHGQLRYWDTVSRILNLWNNNFDNISFDFYLATWRDSKTEGIEKNLKLKNYKEFNHDDMFSNMSPPLKYYFQNIKLARTTPSYQHLYSFLLSESVKLLKESNQTDYKAVILMRPDIFISSQFFNFLNNKLTFNIKNETSNSVEFGHNMVYSQFGSNYTQNRLFCNKDTLFVGSVDSITKFGNIYKDIFINSKFPPIHLHSLQAEYLNWQRIYNKENPNLENDLIREKNNVKPGRPTEQGLLECLHKYPKSFYDSKNYHNIKNILHKHSIDEKAS